MLAREIKRQQNTLLATLKDSSLPPSIAIQLAKRQQNTLAPLENSSLFLSIAIQRAGDPTHFTKLYNQRYSTIATMSNVDNYSIAAVQGSVWYVSHLVTQPLILNTNASSRSGSAPYRVPDPALVVARSQRTLNFVAAQPPFYVRGESVANSENRMARKIQDFDLAFGRAANRT